MFQSVVKEFSLQSHRFVHGFQYAGETPAEGWKRGNYPGLCEKLLAKSQTLVSVSHGLGRLLIYEFEPCLLGFDIVSGE